MSSSLVLSNNISERMRQLKAELDLAREELLQAEAALSAEQAAVNRFRMHCRLKIGVWVDEVLRQRAEYQRLIVRLEMMRQSAEFNIPWQEDDPFWEARAAEFPGQKAPTANDDLILPTDVPTDKAAEKRIYRELARRFHPDLAAAGMERAYATTMMAAVNEAYQSHDVVTLRHLAGELDPEEVSRLSGGDTAAERKLRKSLLGCKRRLAKVSEQFHAMKQENTARLWRKAERLEAEGKNWWDEVRSELEHESKFLGQQLEKLNKRLGN